MSKRNARIDAEPMSKTEKKVFTIIFIVAAALILLVIILNINWNGDRDKFLKEFPIEDKNHVFRYITLTELEEMLTDGDDETFHLFIGTSSTSLNFVSISNTYAKKAGVNEIYYLNVGNFQNASKRKLAGLIGETYDDLFGSGSKYIPTLACFKNDEKYEMSSLSSSDNITSSIKLYFTNCGYDISE